MKNLCENCKYWDRDKEREVLGDCYAPVPISVEVKIKRQTSEKEGHGCGLYSKK